MDEDRFNCTPMTPQETAAWELYCSETTGVDVRESDFWWALPVETQLDYLDRVAAMKANR